MIETEVTSLAMHFSIQWLGSAVYR